MFVQTKQTYLYSVEKINILDVSDIQPTTLPNWRNRWWYFSHIYNANAIVMICKFIQSRYYTITWTTLKKTWTTLQSREYTQQIDWETIATRKAYASGLAQELHSEMLLCSWFEIDKICFGFFNLKLQFRLVLYYITSSKTSTITNFKRKFSFSFVCHSKYTS